MLRLVNLDEALLNHVRLKWGRLGEDRTVYATLVLVRTC
jgi:hypothetical protein